MSEEGTDEIGRSILRSSAELCDLYVLTQSGAIRRTCVPSHFWGFAAFVHVHQGDIKDGFYDEMACTIAERDKCGYAEAFLGVLYVLYENDENYEKFLGACGPREGMNHVIDSFLIQQEEREKLWREAHNEWRKDLPPATD